VTTDTVATGAFDRILADIKKTEIYESVLFLIIFAVLFLSGCGKSGNISKDSHGDSVNRSAAKEEVAELSDDSCKNRTIKMCEEQTGLARGGCYSDFAKVRLDKCLCKTIKSSVQQGKCYADVALGSNDSSLCEKAYSPDRCYLELAFNTGNGELCKKAGSKSDLCSEFFDVAASLQSDACRLETVKGCEGFGDGLTGRVKREKCYVAVAKILKEPCVCLMGQGVFKANCIPAVVMLKKNVKECFSVNEEAVLKNDQSLQIHNCITSLAMRTRNNSLCKWTPYKPADQSGVDICYARYAKMLGQPAVCDKIKDKALVKKCRIPAESAASM
jgi:hypothetical protein